MKDRSPGRITNDERSPVTAASRQVRNPVATTPSHRIGVVVIGRNEGERLAASLASVAGRGHPVVYVDSGSSDGSAARARELADGVIELTPDKPFTAARGRNEGYSWLRARYPSLAFIQFVDGDTVLDPRWIESAAAALDGDQGLAVVAGHLDEASSPTASHYARLLRMEWTAEPGEVDACGGIAMYRSDAFEREGGFSADLYAGEEPELCARLRRAGYRILRISAPMGIHYGGIDSFSAWWKRSVRAGEAALECAWRGGLRWAREDWRRLVSAVVWGGCLPGAIAAIVAVLFLYRRPMLVIVVAAIAVGIYSVLWRRIQAALVRGGEPASDARLFATYCLLSKPAGMLGVIRATWSRLSRFGRARPRGGEPDRPGSAR